MTLHDNDYSAEEQHSQDRGRHDDRPAIARHSSASSCRGITHKESTRYNNSNSNIDPDPDADADSYLNMNSEVDIKVNENDANANPFDKNNPRRKLSTEHRLSSHSGCGQKRSGSFAIDIHALATKHPRTSGAEEAEQHRRVRNSSLIHPKDSPSSGIVFGRSHTQHTNPETEAWLNLAIKYDTDLGRLRYVHPNPELVLNRKHLEMLEAAFQVHKDNLDFLTDEDFEFFAAITGITYKAAKKWFLRRAQDMYQDEASPEPEPETPTPRRSTKERCLRKTQDMYLTEASPSPAQGPKQGPEPPAPSRRFVKQDRIVRATVSLSSDGDDIAAINVEHSTAIIKQDDEPMNMITAAAEPDTTIHDIAANIELPNSVPTSASIDVENSDAIVNPVKDTESCDTAHTPTAIDVKHNDITAKSAINLKFSDAVFKPSGDFRITVVKPTKFVDSTNTVPESTYSIDSKYAASAVTAKKECRYNDPVTNPANPSKLAKSKAAEDRSSSDVVEPTKHDSDSGTIVKLTKGEYNSYFAKSTKYNSSCSNTDVEQSSTSSTPTINTRTKYMWPEGKTISTTQTDKHNDASNCHPTSNFTTRIIRPPLKTYDSSRRLARQGSESPTVVAMPRLAVSRASPSPQESSSAKSDSDNTSPSTYQSYSSTEVIVRNPIQSKYQALQEQKCLEKRTKQLYHGDDFYKEACKPCMEQQGDAICSFEKFRLFRVDNKDDKNDIAKYRYGPDFFSNPSLDKPLRFRRYGLDQEMAIHIFAHTFPFGLAVLEKELLHVMGRPGHTLRKLDLREGPPDANAYIRRPSDDRQYCERCNGAIVAGYWMCCVCGDEICLDCYAFCETTMCTKERQHQRQQFVSCGKFRAATLQTYIAKLRELERDLTPNLTEIAKKASLRSATVATPMPVDKRAIARLPVIVDMEDLDLDTFQRSWRQGQVLLVGGVGTRLKRSWTPEYLVSNHGDAPVTAIRCQDSATDLTDMTTYFSTYFNAGKSCAVWRMG
ncbi:hypothetical protein BGZ95_002334, partial [Linnemannia exigua]